jgi:F420-0:gamma-glutamyl ligase
VIGNESGFAALGEKAQPIVRRGGRAAQQRVGVVIRDGNGRQIKGHGFSGVAGGHATLPMPRLRLKRIFFNNRA